MGENDQGQDKTGIKNPVGMEGCGIYNKAKDVCVKKEKINTLGRKKKRENGVYVQFSRSVVSDSL